MIAFPHAKINLGLRILGKRDDGYHDIETCFYPLPWTDILEIIPAGEWSFALSGIPLPGAPDENLCVRAYQLLRASHGLPPVRMHLHKSIPWGAGLGGGSSDASFALRMLNRMFSLDLTSQQLAEVAARLGSDCPFFLQDEPMIGEGRGELLTSIQCKLQGKFCVVAVPPLAVDTARAYEAVVIKKNENGVRNTIERVALSDWKNKLVNDFEAYCVDRYPAIAAIRTVMYRSGAVFASLTGSGSGLFAIYERKFDPTRLFGDSLKWFGIL